MNVPVILSSVLYFVLTLTSVNCDGQIMEEEIWGPKNGTRIRSFEIVFEEEMIEDLRQRLNNNRPSRPTFEGVGFEYGFNTRELPGWLDYWANDYDFRRREQFLNQFPQFKTTIQGLDIHFIRVVPVVPPEVEIVPILLLHGWSGSLREFYEAIPFLTEVSTHRDFALEVVAPSLPGFGFSDAADRPGLSAEKMATIMRNLMIRLGHCKYYVQGGDWGAVIGSDIATLYPQEVLGYHTNFGLALTRGGLILTLLGSFFPPLVVQPALANRMYPLIQQIMETLQETGYFHIQATKPDTVGIGLSDSPAGFLAYILQLMSTGTNKNFISREDGGLDHYPKDTIIDNLMMYWASNSITTSMRIYKESVTQLVGTGAISTPTEVPTWVIQARHEIVYQSPVILRTKFPNLLHATVLEDGGHYLAMELPNVFTDDVLLAIEAFRLWRRENKM